MTDFRMWNFKSWMIDHFIPIQQNIKVDDSRPPSLFSHAAESLLNRKQRVKKWQWPQGCFQYSDAIYKSRLILDGPDRPRFNECGHGPHRDAVFLTKKIDRAKDVGLAVAEI